MYPRRSILDLPNELLVPILGDVIKEIKPQESIRNGIVKLSWTCRRFHQVMQYFLESTCFVGISIPVRESQEKTTAPITVGKGVNISYRLLKYNTKGARGPFVKKLDLYGGLRESYSEYQRKQKQNKKFASIRGHGSHIDIATNLLGTVYDDVIKGFKNLTIASIQNTPDSLFVHLIPGLQNILAHCPLLVELKLSLFISREKDDDLAETLGGLSNNTISTSARLRELDITISESKESSKPWQNVPQAPKPDDDKGGRMYPIEILGKVFGTSITSVRALRTSYTRNNKKLVSLLPVEPSERWNITALRSLQFPVTGEVTYQFLTGFCEIDYSHVQELTLGGLIGGDCGPDDAKAVSFLRQFSGLKTLKIELLNLRNLPWLYFVLGLDFSSFFPSLKTVKVRTTPYFWRDLQEGHMSSFTKSLDNFALKHKNDKVDASKYEVAANPPAINAPDEIFEFSIPSS
ncbi:hypothetical protein TWF718_002172 [Orbilia javanica]|uniref:Uncharacterized protein n=1 Tax=Orbilia javanica TaxID=47235 RepID=A0AAN8RJI9_9PEZI